LRENGAIHLPPPKLWGTIALVLILALFLIFGPSVGWRAVGLLQLLFSVQVFLKPEIPVGWEGREPSFILRGPLAILVGVLNLGFVVMLLFFQEETVMQQ
jgi:hypothetical protein